jgi:hypothetical protein
VGLTDLDFYQATAALPPLRHVTNKRAKLAPRAASPHQDTKAISNHQFGAHSHHKR